MSKLLLTIQEKLALKQAMVNQNQLVEFSSRNLAKLTKLSTSRCQQLIVLSQLQQLSSVGPKMAEKIYNLGFDSLEKLKKAKPLAMVKHYEKQVNCHVDPCVEDVFRCAIAQVKYPQLPENMKDWWYWSDKRGTKEVKI